MTRPATETKRPKPGLRELLEGGDLIRPDELARGLKVSNGAVYQWVDRGLIPYIRLGKCLRFDPLEIKEWLEKQRQVAQKNPGVKMTRMAT
jgi:excisionase family DNA binding protein